MPHLSPTMLERKRLCFALDLKSIDATGKFAGYASVFEVVDNQRDAVMRGAFVETIKNRLHDIKLLWQHQQDEPIGVLTQMFEDARGLYVEGVLLLDVQRAREAYALLKAGALRGLSIGYSPVRYTIDSDTGVRHLAAVQLWEISLVTFPANQAAKVTVVKSQKSCDSPKARAQGHFIISPDPAQSLPAIRRINTTKESTMSLNEITSRVNALGNAWEQFKQINDARLSDIERKGSADPLYMEHLSKIGDALDHTKSRLDQIETASMRPALDLSGKMPAENSEYRKAFCNYLRKGMDAGLEAMQVKALSVGSDPDGGYLVTPTMSQRIVTAIYETSPVRQIASVETISTDSLEMIDDHDQAAAGWTSETASVAETATPIIAKRHIPVHELYAQPKATQKLVDDSAIDIEGWIAMKVADIFARKESTAFVSGNGVGQPRGILTYAAGTSWNQIEQINSGTNGAVTADGVINLFYGLKDAYSRRATFLMNRSIVAAVRLLKQATTNQYLWQPGLAAGQPDTLLGAPVMMATDMPVAATGSLSIAVGDFQAAYQIVDRNGIRTLRDPFTEKPFVKFYTTKRVGGDVVNFEAVKLMKLSA